MKQTGLIVALDTPDLGAARKLGEALAGRVSALKIGLTLYAAHGPDAIEELRPFAPIFCDLKLHDIPHQVRLASAELARLGVWMMTVHSSGGASVVSAAVEGSRSLGGNPPLVAAVTVLTSMSDEEHAAVGQGDDLVEHATQLAKLATSAGAGAIVCSGREIAAVRSSVGDEISIVVPGVRPFRPQGDDDQVRVVSPSEAVLLGADYVVVGRPITADADPPSAAQRILEELGAPNQ